MYIYGGHIPDPLNYIRDVKNDMYAFHFKTRKWAAITAADGSPPFPSKTEHTGVVHGDSMYLFGGYSNGTMGYSDIDVYAVHLLSRSVERIPAVGEAPSDRSAHSAVVYHDHMYIFGGWDGTTTNNDFHAFHIPSRTWARVEYSGISPPCIRSHATVVYKDSMLVFGGYGELVQHPSSLYIYHFLGKCWEEIQFAPSLCLSSSAQVPAGPSAVIKGPCGRSRFRMVIHNHSLWVFGGWDRQAYFADLWRFRLSTRVWSHVSTDFELQGVGQHSLVVSDNQMYLYGGYCSVAKAPHPHLYIYRFPRPRNEEA